MIINKSTTDCGKKWNVGLWRLEQKRWELCNTRNTNGVCVPEYPTVSLRHSYTSI